MLRWQKVKKESFVQKKKISFLLPIYVNLVYLGQGIGKKGKEMALSGMRKPVALYSLHTLFWYRPAQHDYSQGNCRTMSLLNLNIE